MFLQLQTGSLLKWLRFAIGAILTELEPYEVCKANYYVKIVSKKLDLHRFLQFRTCSFVKQLQIVIGAVLNELEAYEDCKVNYYVKIVSKNWIYIDSTCKIKMLKRS